jgi:hypothetical protein
VTYIDYIRAIAALDTQRTVVDGNKKKKLKKKIVLPRIKLTSFPH